MKKLLLGVTVALLAVGGRASAQMQMEGQLPRIGGISLDTGKTSIATLLRRSDVQNAIRLDMRQRRDIRALLDEPVGFRVQGGPDAALDDARPRAQQQMRGQMGDAEAQIKAILKPAQWQRLQELSLQLRGPLALADPAIAEKVKLTPEHRAEISAIASRYAAVKSEVLMSLAQTNQEASADGSRRTVSVRLDTSSLERPMSPARQKIEAAKKEAENKILSLLSDEEQANWQALCGKPFTFRKDLPGLRL